MKHGIKPTWSLILAGIGIGIALGFLVWMQGILIPSASSALTLDDQTLEAKALDWARIHGLQGTPVAKRSVRMTLGQWLTTNGGQLAAGATQFELSPDVPVYVLALRAQVEWRGPGSLSQGQISQEHFDNITIVLDARNGNLLSAGTARSSTAMPIPVPINTLTPVAPILLLSTETPQIPPTLVPRATVPRPPVSPTPKPYP